MFLNHLSLLPTVASTVGVSTDFVKAKAKEQVVLVQINIDGKSSRSFCRFDYVLVRKVDDSLMYLIILTLGS